MKIVGKSIATVEQMMRYIMSVNPTVPASVLNMIPFYISEGADEGIRGDIAFAQSCLETGNFKFEGSAVTLDQHNYCGMGVARNGEKGCSFKNAQIGIRAQIQHLKAYATDEKLNGTCVDPRFTYVKRKSAEHVEWLGSAENPNGYGWATGSGYGKKIIEILNKIIGDEKGDDVMNILICVGHAKYPNGVISSADGRKKGGVNEYEYNKELAPKIVEWIKKAGHNADLCIAPEEKLTNLKEEINHFIGVENKKDYSLAVQLHLNAYNGNAYGCEAYAYSSTGLAIAERICSRLGTTWKNRGARINQGLYWTRLTRATAVLVESFFCDNTADCEKAKKIGMSAHAKLIAEGIVGRAITEPSKENEIESEAIRYKVQIGTYKDRAEAEKMIEKLSAAGFEGIIKEI